MAKYSIYSPVPSPQTDHAILEEEKLLLEERVRELTIQLERAQEKVGRCVLSADIQQDR